MGRSFHSPAGTGIYLSLILRPECQPEQLMHLTCATAVAACDAISRTAGFLPGIKWTNDLVFGKRKLAGILTELSLNAKTGTVDYAVIGVGINCCQHEGDFPEELRSIATSLNMVTKTVIDRQAVTAALIEALFDMDGKLLSDPIQTMARYRSNCITIGQQVSVCRGDTVRYGTAMDVDDAGALLVKFSDGTLEAVNSGEVSVRGMYGYV